MGRIMGFHGLKPKNIHKVTSTSTSSRTGPFDSNIIWLAADADINYAFGDAAVTASVGSAWLPANSIIELDRWHDEYLAVVGTATVYIMEMGRG